MADIDQIMLTARRPALLGPRVDVEELLYDPGPLAETYQGELFTGTAFELWPDGRIRSEEEFICGYRCGLSRIWNSDGRLEEEGFLWNESLHGALSVYHSNGRLKSWSWSEFGVGLESKRWDESGTACEHNHIEKSDPFWDIWWREGARFDAGQSHFPPLPPRPSAPILPGEDDPRS